MVTHSQDDDTVDPKSLLDAQLREAFGRVTYSHKVHEKEVEIRSSLMTKIKITQIVLPAASTAGFVTALFGTGWWGSLAGAACSAALLALNLYTRNYDLEKQVRDHKMTAIQIWGMREKYLSLITDLSAGFEPLAAVRGRRDALADEIQSIYATAPSTTGSAYKKARKALRVDEEMTFSVAEVDALLPENLRRN